MLLKVTPLNIMHFISPLLITLTCAKRKSFTQKCAKLIPLFKLNVNFLCFFSLSVYNLQFLKVVNGIINVKRHKLWKFYNQSISSLQL